jgi:hypothetical protein
MELHAVFRHEASGALLVIGQLYRLGEKSEFLATFDDMLRFPYQPGQQLPSTPGLERA